MSWEQSGKYTFLAPTKVCCWDLSEDMLLEVQNVIWTSLIVFVGVWICFGVPCRRPPCQQATCWLVSCWSMSFCIPNCFGDLEAPFWLPWVTILVIQGSTVTPSRHLEVQASIVIDFNVIWEYTGTQFGHLSVIFVVIWDATMGGSFQVRVWWSRDGNEARMQCLCVL